MKTELEKQIESAEYFVSNQSDSDEASVLCGGIKCKDCFGLRIGCGSTYGDAKAFLKKHKTEVKVITKSELIENCRGKVFECESQEEWDLCVEKCKSVGVVQYWRDSFYYWGSHNSFKSFSLIDNKFLCTSKMPNATAQDFLNLFTLPVTTTKNSTVIDNPSVETKKIKVGNVDVTVEYSGNVNPHEPVLTNREQILKNKKDVVEVCNRALECRDDSGLLCKYCPILKKYEYFNIPHTPEQLARVTEWYNNLESVKVGV